MADFTCTVSVAPWLRELMAAEVETTRHLQFAGPTILGASHPENPADCGIPRCPAKSPPAVALAELARQLRAGPQVKLSMAGWGRSEKAQLSECLAQSARRPSQDGVQGEVRAALADMCRVFDAAQRVPEDPAERVWQAGEAARARAAQARQAEAREQALRDRDRERAAEARRVLTEADA